MVELELTSKSQAFFERAKKLMPGGVNSPVRAFEPYPFFINRAKGSKLYGADGESYIDYCMAYGALILGHAYSEVINAVHGQLWKGTFYGVPTELEIDFAELIQKLSPCMKMLRLVNSGSEATMHAIRAARGFTGRKKIIKFDGCYHGAHDCVLIKAGSGATTFGAPTSPGIPEETTQNTIIIPYNSFEALEETLKREGNNVAAVIVEPVIGNAGLILPKSDFLSYLRKATEEHDIILIFDEIITGFRLALGGAQEYYNVKADMVTLGKVMGGGFPISAFGGRKDIMQNVSPAGKVYQAGTFSGNPVSVTAGLTTLTILNRRRNDIYPELEKNSVQLKKALTDLAADHHIEAQVYNIASMFQIFFSRQAVTDYASAKLSDTRSFQAYFRELLKQGVFIPPSQFETSFLTAAHTEEDMKHTIGAFDKALHAASTLSRYA